MKTSETIISTLRDVPADAVIASHQLMLRAGLIRKLGNGLYTYLPLGLRSFRKVENIVREELDAVGFLEFKPTVVIPGDLWKESGRWETFGNEMLKMKTRGGQDMVVSPTAEEAFTALFRDLVTSYKQLPCIGYQINTKYRDEIRPRYGVMRGREFCMMDAYSFDADEKSLDRTYTVCAKAYGRIFKRLGLTTISVRADTGAMGGSGSEEFMVESEVGDNTLILCPKCGYAANVEKAACRQDTALDKNGKPQKETKLPYEPVDCPDVKSIDDMIEFFKTPSQQFIKVLIYKVENCALDLQSAPGGKTLKQVNDKVSGSTYYPKTFFAVCIRGDLDVNETKLAAVLKASSVELAGEEDVVRLSGAPHGFVGPVGLSSIPIIADNSIMSGDKNGNFTVHVHDTITGGLKKDIDYKHVEPGRDFTPWLTGDLRIVTAGDKCPDCGETLYSKKGNELGHIFKLGDKYTKSMHVTYLDEAGKQQTPIMGCYGIGIDRTLASIIEEHHDKDGIIWTMSTTPYQVAIVPIKYEGTMKDTADRIYAELNDSGIEVLLDDRNERPGVKFKDMDLIGIPVRIVIGDRNLPNVEIKERAIEKAELVPATDAAEKTAGIIRKALAELNA